MGLPEHPARILMVDDQPGKLLTYEAILSDLGETLIKATSAREALEQLLKYDIAVVLIDVQMPEVDGFELAGMIREHPRFQQTALIFVSAIHLSEIDRLRGYEAGAVDYVSVPVVPEVLRAKVRVFVDLHRKTRALERLNAELERRVADRTAALERTADELLSLNCELETRIEERTREREQALAQLFEAQKIDTIGQLTGGVAHDFNNLLMAMMGSMELLKKRLPDDPAAQRLLSNALQGAERGRALTQRLLAFARRQNLRPAPTDVEKLVTGMRDLLARAIGPGVTIEEDFPAGLPPVLIDANQLELAILNLTVNARDAMGSGGIITIGAVEASSAAPDAPKGLTPGRYLRLSVTDNGAGMTDEVLARATEPFFTTKGVGKGTGLGLPMVQGLSAQSGGGIKIASAEGVGTKVELWIPLAEGAANRTEDGETATWSPPQSQMKPLRALLVDDDGLVLAGTSAMLEDLGHAVVSVTSGQEALEILERDARFDLIITDHSMPGLTGLELVQRVRERYADMRMIMATGFAELTPGLLDEVSVPTVSKPYSQADLANAIERVCSTAAANAMQRQLV